MAYKLGVELELGKGPTNQTPLRYTIKCTVQYTGNLEIGHPLIIMTVGSEEVKVVSEQWQTIGAVFSRSYILNEFLPFYILNY